MSNGYEVWLLLVSGVVGRRGPLHQHRRHGRPPHACQREYYRLTSEPAAGRAIRSSDTSTLARFVQGDRQG